MSRYRMDNGAIVDTTKASKSWDEATYWDGHNHISKATGSQWDHQTLYRSRRGSYYLEHTSAYQGTRPHVEWVSPQEATRWLLTNDYDVDAMPADLIEHAEDLVE